MLIYDRMTELVGKTPLVRLGNIEKQLGLVARLVIKLEGMNPAGSAKDRVALGIIEALRVSDRLTADTVIIEPTSGNTGIGIAAVAAAYGISAIIVMPENMSEERKALIRAYGARLVLTDAKLGMSGAIAEAERLAKEIPNAVIAGQFINPENPAVHERTTGPEIYRDTDGEIDILVAGVGTGGTLTGAGRYLKNMKPECEIVAVEPKESAVISGGMAGAHGIQGIGAGFIPEVLDTTIIDKVMTISTDEAMKAARLTAESEGILIGISGGAALKAAIELAGCEENRGKLIVAVMPDSGERYLSTGLYK